MCLAVALWLCGGPAAAQTDRATLAKITVQNNSLLTRRQILDELGLRQRMPLDRQEIEAALAHWNESGVYGTISSRIEPTEEGDIELVLNVSERVQVTSVKFQGNKHLSAQRLSELTGLKAWDVVTPFTVQAHEKEIEAAYRKEGYSMAAARGVVRILGPNERELILVIAEGTRTWVERVEFEGNVHVERDRLIKVMRSRQHRWPRWIWAGWFDRPTFEEDVRRIEAAYRDRGYQDARAGGHVVYSDDMRRVALRVIIHEGELYTVKEIAFEGNTLFRDDELLAAMPFVAGEAFQQKDLEVAVNRISDLYAAQGHVDVVQRKGNLRAEPIYSEVGTDVSLKFTITEGEPVFIRRIEIRGLEKTRENVVRRNLTLYPGQLASSERIKESERILTNTGYFDRRVRKPVQITLTPDEGPLRDAVVEVKEGMTGMAMLGGAIGSDAGVMGEASLVQENFDLWNWPSSWNDIWHGNAFQGGGHVLSVTLSSGTQRSYYAIDFLNPAVWDTDYTLGTSLYSKGMARTEFNETRTGLSVRGGQKLSPFLQRGVTVGYESINIGDISLGAADVIRKDKGTHAKPYTRFDFSIDHRDNRFEPTEGHYAGADVELAVGGVNTIKLGAEAKKYWTVRQERGENKHVIGVGARLGLVTSIAGRVPVFERLYAGGMRTLRGFAFEGVSPVDARTKQQIGGQSMLIGSVEYSFPISEEDHIRFVTFTDAGYVNETIAGILPGLDDLRIGVGAGIRWRVPFLGGTPLEIALAFPLMKEAGDETQNIHFAFGARRQF